MDNHSIVMRVAKPTFDEGLIFARYLDEAAEGFFSFLLGRRAMEIIAKAFIQPEHSYSFQHVIFAEHDKVIAGMASGYTAKQHQCFSELPLKQAAGGWTLRMMTVGILCVPLLKALDTVADGDFYLQAIAIDKKFRGKGIGSALIDFIEDRARTSGANRLSLDVSARNQGARRLYERREMTVKSQWPKHLIIPGLKLFRMTKTLKK
jgi:ribosomal protein S18 acetylase RimI-like enzyme